MIVRVNRLVKERYLMTTATYAVRINRPIQDVVDYLMDFEPRHLPAEGGFSFEAIRGGTRIYYTTSRGVNAFFRMADMLISQISRRDSGQDVPEVVFEA
jgi:hypothetical protein